MDSKQKLINAFERHVSGNTAEATTLYNEVLRADPNNLFARVLINMINMQFTFTRMSKHSALLQLRQNGFLPQTVIDVGAQVGTAPLYEVFPEAHHILLEPMEEHEPILRQICQSLKSAEYKIAAVSHRGGTVALQFSDNKQYAEIVEGKEVGKNVRMVDVISLNELCTGSRYAGPFLIKIDVDGKEIDVLRGATVLADPGNIFVIEATLIDTDPRFIKIIDFFRPYGFVLHDIVDVLHRPSDMALWQVDVIVVHESSQFRTKKSYV